MSDHATDHLRVPEGGFPKDKRGHAMYPPDFKRAFAVAVVNGTDSCDSLARTLGVPSNTAHTWVRNEQKRRSGAKDSGGGLSPATAKATANLIRMLQDRIKFLENDNATLAESNAKLTDSVEGLEKICGDYKAQHAVMTNDLKRANRGLVDQSNRIDELISDLREIEAQAYRADAAAQWLLEQLQDAKAGDKPPFIL